MIKLLIRRLIPNAEQTKSPDVRAKYALLTGAVGILCNLVLFLIRLIIGMLMNSSPSHPMPLTTFPISAHRSYLPSARALQGKDPIRSTPTGTDVWNTSPLFLFPASSSLSASS